MKRVDDAVVDRLEPAVTRDSSWGGLVHLPEAPGELGLLAQLVLMLSARELGILAENTRAHEGYGNDHFDVQVEGKEVVVEREQGGEKLALSRAAYERLVARVLDLAVRTAREKSHPISRETWFGKLGDDAAAVVAAAYPAGLPR